MSLILPKHLYGVTPDLRWDTLSVDFVVKLSLSSGHNAVITVVDSVSKQAHFIPTHTTVTAEEQPGFSYTKSESSTVF